MQVNLAPARSRVAKAPHQAPPDPRGAPWLDVLPGYGAGVFF